ncbi:MAG TPA: HD domain-containing protein [Actinomycetota bacterium]|nr:HD domain-containing protein [Actinomycetota bacterium]
MDRESALALVRQKTEKGITFRHLVSVEGIMRRLGRHFGEDEHLWALAGLFHDLDQDQTHHDLQRHGHLTAEWLLDTGVDEAVSRAALAHAHPEYRTDLLTRAIVHADALSGLLVACALVRPEKARGMKVSSVKKKLKDRAFAPGVARDDITASEESIGLSVDELIRLGIEGLQEVAAETGLQGPPP